ncbi:hypothetical protein MRB53_026015 [Persea americana]|uniref:Uncharacterized protein n=1 Tax=Persea americana TaxID=3435 RepID=A0ACC2LH00_PERAE|nr:hypothetical protein MRB53_026015 [Persea americana]
MKKVWERKPYCLFFSISSHVRHGTVVSSWRRMTDGDERHLDLDYLLRQDGSPEPLFALLPVPTLAMSSSTQSGSCPVLAAVLRIKSFSSTVGESRSSANSGSAR